MFDCLLSSIHHGAVNRFHILTSFQQCCHQGAVGIKTELLKHKKMKYDYISG